MALRLRQTARHGNANEMAARKVQRAADSRREFSRRCRLAFLGLAAVQSAPPHWHALALFPGLFRVGLRGLIATAACSMALRLRQKDVRYQHSKNKETKMPTLNWVYGAKSPDIEQTVSDAIYAAHKYRNRLCELELEKRKRHEELLQRLAPAYVAACELIADCENELGEAREAIQEERKKQRTKKPIGVQAYVDAAKACKVQLKELRANRKEAKQSAYEDARVIAAMEENSATHKQDCKVAKDESGLYWGTESITKTACGSFASGAPPRFKRFDGCGQLAVQLQNGHDCKDAFDPDTRLQLIVPDALQAELLVCGKAPRSVRKAVCQIRIGSDETGKPIFAKLPINFHRPLPNGRIKWAYLERRMMADKPRWKIRLTIDVLEKKEEPKPGMVAVHVGWLWLGGGLQAATWEGDDGLKGNLVLPTSHCDDYLVLDRIKSKRDRDFATYRDELKEWIRETENAPEWMKELASTMHAWKNPARLSALVLRWRNERFEGDEIFERLDLWRKKDKRQWQHFCRLSKRIVRRRTNWYREFAYDLEQQYGTLIVTPIEAKKLTEHSDPEDLERDNTLAARRAKWAAVSDLTRMLSEKFRLRTIKESARGISEICYDCGGKNVVDHRRKVKCKCGKTYDQDENALLHTLARGRVAVKSGALLDLAQKQEDKVAAGKAKLAKMQEARRASRKKKLEASGCK